MPNVKRLRLDLFRHPVVESLAKEVLMRRLMVFLGAGASISVLPGAGRLADELAHDLFKLCQIAVTKSERYDLMVVGRRYEQALGRKALIDFLKSRLASDQPSRIHQLVAELGCRNIVTTNYDTLQEQAVAALGRTVKRIATIEDLVTSEGAAVKVLKLHGSIDVRDTVGEGAGINKARCAPFIVTTDDYYRYYISSQYLHPFESLLVAWLFTHRCLFVGYSMSDPNFQKIIQYLNRIITENDLNTEVQLCAVTLGASEASQVAWSERGVQIINCDGAEFLDILANRTASEAMG